MMKHQETKQSERKAMDNFYTRATKHHIKLNTTTDYKQLLYKPIWMKMNFYSFEFCMGFCREDIFKDLIHMHSASLQ